MSMWYASPALTLKVIVSPRLTLIVVAYPCSVLSPASGTFQSPSGSPGWAFSQAITLVTGGPHGLAAAAARAGGTAVPSTRTNPAATASRHRRLTAAVP